jgi:hypothetical protein
MMPTVEWGPITHEEPYVDPLTKTIKVKFINADDKEDHTINAFFWDPHSIVGPGDAFPYQGVEE